VRTTNNSAPHYVGFLHSPVISSLVGPNTLLSTLFSNALSLRSSLNVSDHFSHPYKTTGKVIVLRVYIHYYSIIIIIIPKTDFNEFNFNYTFNHICKLLAIASVV
jgi:hypothetical protein